MIIGPCPPEKVVSCLIDPCKLAKCPAFPDAKCVSEFCGGCNARFFNAEGEEVTDKCGMVVHNSYF